uniref:KRAB domain-containing protein n=1 Tax=Vombatus ursinus TaxID=29139 RepID=A0A4X2JZY0_VOMUR
IILSCESSALPLQETAMKRKKWPLASRAHQESVTFKDIALGFTQEEQGHLAPSQKELYWEVILENYGHLICLELKVSKPDVISQLERGEHLGLQGEKNRGLCLFPQQRVEKKCGKGDTNRKSFSVYTDLRQR